MTDQKRVPNPNGRPKGVPNKATMAAREAIAEFVDGNAERLTYWLDDIAYGIPLEDKDGNQVYDAKGYQVFRSEPNPEGAFKAFMSVVEYHIPKLQRSEITGKDGKDIIPEQAEQSASLVGSIIAQLAAAKRAGNAEPIDMDRPSEAGATPPA